MQLESIDPPHLPKFQPAVGSLVERPGSVLIENAIRIYVDDTEARHLKTYRRLFQQLNIFAKERGYRLLDELDETVLGDFCASLNALNSWSVRKLKAFFQFAQKHGWISLDPGRKLERQRRSGNTRAAKRYKKLWYKQNRERILDRRHRRSIEVWFADPGTLTPAQEARYQRFSFEQFTAATSDKDWEDKNGIRDGVMCRVFDPQRGPCRAKVKDWKKHGPATHGITPEEYHRLFPGVPLMCEETKEKSRRLLRPYAVVPHLVKGKSVKQTAEDITADSGKATSVREGTVVTGARAADLSVGFRYDLGIVVRKKHLRNLHMATGGDVVWFARTANIPRKHAYSISPRRGAAYRVVPAIANPILDWRDRIVEELLRTAGVGGGGGRYRVRRFAAALLPGLREAEKLWLEGLTACRMYLRDCKGPVTAEELEDWIYDQAVREKRGKIQGNLFRLFLPLAGELMPYFEKNPNKLTELRGENFGRRARYGGARLAELAIETFAWRLNLTTSIVRLVCHSRSAHALEPRAVRALIDEIDRQKLSERLARASAVSAKPPKRDPGRPPGKTGRKAATIARMWFIASIKYLGQSLRSNSNNVFPDTPATAEPNTYRLASEERSAIKDLIGSLTEPAAALIFKEAPKLILEALDRPSLRH